MTTGWGLESLASCKAQLANTTFAYASDFQVACPLGSRQQAHRRKSSWWSRSTDRWGSQSRTTLPQLGKQELCPWRWGGHWQAWPLSGQWEKTTTWWCVSSSLFSLMCCFVVCLCGLFFWLACVHLQCTLSSASLSPLTSYWCDLDRSNGGACGGAAGIKHTRRGAQVCEHNSAEMVPGPRSNRCLRQRRAQAARHHHPWWLVPEKARLSIQKYGVFVMAYLKLQQNYNGMHRTNPF